MFKRLNRWYRRHFKTAEFSIGDHDQLIVVLHFNDTYVHNVRSDRWKERPCQLNEHGAFSSKIRRQMKANEYLNYTCVIFSSRSMHR